MSLLSALLRFRQEHQIEEVPTSSGGTMKVFDRASLRAMQDTMLKEISAADVEKLLAAPGSMK